MLRKNQAAPTPPMGWNSWDCYAATVTEKQLLDNAAYMAEHLKSHGWQYIVCDIQWSEPKAGSDEIIYRNFAELCLDEYGRQIPAINRFPSSAEGKGFRPIADRIHAMGLKFGIHIMRGIPRQAVHKRMPVRGSPLTADQIALPYSICCWNGDMYGLDASNPEAQKYYDSIFALYASWGVDYVKVDDICHEHLYPNDPYGEGEVEMIRHAIDKTGRDMVLSLSPGPAVIERASHMERNANMWRITDDFWDKWELLQNMFERCDVWQKHVSTGCWPDCDMLPLGHIGIAYHEDRQTRFAHNEQITMMTLWSIFRSPLMMGGVLTDCDDWTLSLLTNDDVLRLNGHSHGAFQICRNDWEAVWGSFDEDGSFYLALFNLSEETREISCLLSEFGIRKAHIYNLWKQREENHTENNVVAAVPSHGAVFYRLRAFL